MLFLLTCLLAVQPEPPSIQRGLAHDLFDKLPGVIVLHMDFDNIWFNADLEKIIDMLRFELSSLIGLSGRRMRLSLEKQRPPQMDFTLEIATKISALDGVGDYVLVQDVLDALRNAIIEGRKSLRLASSIWARRIREISLVMDEATGGAGKGGFVPPCNHII